MNEDQIAYWNGEAGAKWTAHQDVLDRSIEPLGLAGIDAARPARGERVLDVGCGCGSTTLELARRVGPAGAVTGVDISAPMLARACERAQGHTVPLRFVEADAATHAFEPGAFDLAFSRFGVMFFDDPTMAFANIRHGLAPNGRLAFVCWRAVKENTWVTSAMDVVLRYVERPTPPDPEAPGPFAFANPARVERILTGAGFREIAIAPFDAKMPLGGGEGPGQAADFTMEIGPIGRLIAEADADLKARVRADLVTLYEGMRGADSRVLADAAIWVVTARNVAAR